MRLGRYVLRAYPEFAIANIPFRAKVRLKRSGCDRPVSGYNYGQGYT